MLLANIQAMFSDVKINTGLSRFERSRVYPLVVLLSITLLAVALRFYKLGQWGFWIDEILEMKYSQEALANFFNHSRVSVWLLGVTLRALGPSEWNARLAPALVGMLTIPLLYFPARKLFGSTVALVFALLLALSPWHLFWSQNARFYTFLMLFYALGQFFFFFWLETDRIGYLLAAGLFLGLAVLERMISAFFVPVAAAYLLALPLLRFGNPKAFTLRNLLLIGGPAVLAGVAFIIATGFLGDFYYYIVGHQHSSIRVALSIVYDLGLPLFLAGLLGAAFLLVQRSRAGLFLTLAAVVPVVLLVLIAPFTQTFSRYVFMTLPSWALLAAVAAKELFTQARGHARLLAIGLVLILAADAFSSDVLYYSFQNGNREDWKGAFAIVAEQQQPGDRIISTRPEIGQYYLGAGTEITDSQAMDLESELATGQPLWFVLDNRTYVSPDLQAWVDEHTRLQGVRDVSVPGKTYQMRVYLYDPAFPVR